MTVVDMRTSDERELDVRLAETVDGFATEHADLIRRAAGAPSFERPMALYALLGHLLSTIRALHGDAGYSIVESLWRVLGESGGFAEVAGRAAQLDQRVVFRGSVSDLVTDLVALLGARARVLERELGQRLARSSVRMPVRADHQGRWPARCSQCDEGRIFRDARGGYECTCCDARYHIADVIGPYAGQKKKPVGFLGQLRRDLARLIAPR